MAVIVTFPAGQRDRRHVKLVACRQPRARRSQLLTAAFS